MLSPLVGEADCVTVVTIQVELVMPTPMLLTKYSVKAACNGRDSGNAYDCRSSCRLAKIEADLDVEVDGGAAKCGGVANVCVSV